MRFLYSALLALALVLGLPYWAIQALRRGKYRAGLAQRWGRVPPHLRLPPGERSIWVHAVSVGEVLAVSRVVEELRARYPGDRILVSTTTATGQELARKRFGAENVFYFPLDFALAIRPWMRALCPRAVILAETEFWPNFLRLAHRRGARIAVLNARISDRSLPRYRRFRSLMKPVLEKIDLFLAQTEEDGFRLMEIGAPAQRVQISGNLKFDINPPAAAPLVEQLREALAAGGGSPVLVCGSTVAGEERLLLDALRALRERFPRAVLILAPRHPERFPEVAVALLASGLPFWRRSQWSGAPVDGGVFLLDSIGELASVYALAQVAFIGGSLVPAGGHNVLEPAHYGVAIVVGPHTENFRDIVARFRQAKALRETEPNTLPSTLRELLSDDRACREMGARAAALLQSQVGGTARTMKALEALLRDNSGSALPSPAPGPARPREA